MFNDGIISHLTVIIDEIIFPWLVQFLNIVHVHLKTLNIITLSIGKDTVSHFSFPG